MSSDEEIEFVSETRANADVSSEVVLSSGDESDDENLPDGPECLRRCKEFASVTGTDNALAMFYLQSNKWDLEKSIDIYLTATQGSDGDKKKVVACFDVEKLDKDEKRKSDEFNESVPKRPCSDFEDLNQINENSAGSEDTKHFKVLSWNIDGIDGAAVEARAMGVAQKISTEKPDVVFLQEVIYQNECILREKLSKTYNFYSGKEFVEYYTMILTKKTTCSDGTRSLIRLENSVMGRNLLKIDLKYAGKVDLCVMTSHFESTAEYGPQRMVQLKRAVKEMLDQDEQKVVIFGGDLNMRDKEVTSIGGLPRGISDVWESTGSRKEAAYTWDMTRNTNLTWNAKFRPRCRFDRLYYRGNETENSGDLTLMPVYFELEGLEKLKTCSRFCSDHWAIQAYFDLK